MLEAVSEIHDSDHDVVIIGATNRPDRIDDAMLRAGRLTTKIEVPYPDEEARMLILDEQLEAPRRPDLDLREVAPHTDNLSAADMEAIADEAARLAMDRDESVDEDDLITAIEKVR
jgi:transitional endoplasmic reticulum ATPase